MSYKKNNQKRTKISGTIFQSTNNDDIEIPKVEALKKNEHKFKNTIFSKINNSLQEIKMEIDDMRDVDFLSFKNKLEHAINSNKILSKEIPLLLREILGHIIEIQNKANDPNTISNKAKFENQVTYLYNKAKELENLQKLFNHNNISSQRSFDSSGDIIEINHKYNYMGNKERQNTGKALCRQENLLETIGSTSKNHTLINIENSQIAKQLKINNQIKYNNNYDDLFIKAINCSIYNICKFINERAKSIYDLDLSYIYLKKLYEITINNYKEFIESTIKDIYLGKFLKINHEERGKINTWIYALLYAEKKDKNEKVKILNILFSKRVKEILLLYINDDPYIQVKNENNSRFNLKGFNTSRYDFNEYSIEIKEYFLSLLDNIIININNKE